MMNRHSLQQQRGEGETEEESNSRRGERRKCKNNPQLLGREPSEYWASRCKAKWISLCAQWTPSIATLVLLARQACSLPLPSCTAKKDCRWESSALTALTDLLRVPLDHAWID